MGKYNFKTTPDPHQAYALKECLRHKKYGLFFQQRVGKTKVAIDFCGATHTFYNTSKVLIISPLSVRREWFSQLHEHLGVEDFDVLMYPGSSEYKAKEKRKQMTKDYNKPKRLTFIICNYGLLRNEINNLRDWNPDVLIYDEIHLLKSQNSKRSKAAYRLSRDTADYILGLTGTPVPKYWYDVFAIFRAIDHTIFGHRWTDFKNTYAIMGGYRGKQIVGCTNQRDIADTMGANSIRVLRKEVFDEPDIEHVTIPVEFNSKELKTYHNLKTEYMLELEESDVVADMAAVRLMRLQQLTGGFVKDEFDEVHQLTHAKLDAVVDLIRTHIEGGEQLVVFHRFSHEGRAIVDNISKFCDAKPYNGSTSEEDRHKTHQQFIHKEIDVIVMQIATGAMGISLATSHINIFYSLDFSLANYLQARDRVMGRKQESDVVTNYYMAVENTVDEKIIKTLQNDEDVASAIADKWQWFMD